MLINTPQREKAWEAHAFRLKEVHFVQLLSPPWDEGCLKRVDEAYTPGGMDNNPRRE
jgi:hypothetical protein